MRWRRQKNRRVSFVDTRLTNRLRTGLWVGAAATACLDAVRLTGFLLNLMPGNMPRMFGVLLLNRMEMALKRFRSEHPEVEIHVLEPDLDEGFMFSQGYMSYATRIETLQHAYQSAKNKLFMLRERLENWCEVTKC